MVRYNPEIIRVAKETAYTALKERELQDNAIAAEKGLKPYTLLNVEFNDGADQQSNGYIGWYYATLAVDGKICTHLETGLNHDIASGSVSPTPTRENYYAAGALKESDVDYVFNNVGFSSVSGLYSLHLSDAARERAELELAKKLIDDYCREEFHSGADFSDLSAVGIGHTTVTDDEVPIQAYANLADFRIEKYLGDVLIESRQYESLAALIQGELNDLEFGDLTYASDEQIAMFHAQEEVSGKEATSLNPAVQPVVTILWSESDKLQEGEQLPLARADALFKALDEEKRSEREKPGYTGGWYDKTKFRIDCTFHGERDSYEGRQDFGDGDGALIDHIQAYHEYYAKDESWKNFVLHNEGAEAWEKDKAERATLLTEFVPYMRLHCNLSEQERTAADMLENGENLTPEQTAYFHAVLAHVDACREKLNAGDYHLPDPPQLSDFDKELQDYKAHVESEIAQEAEAAGMEDTQPEYKLIDLQPLVSSLYDSAKIICTKNGKELILQNDISVLQLSLDSAFISQVCNNLISNAVRYARTLVTISFTLHDNGLLLSVSDDGNGFDKDSLQKAANPYFTGESNHSEHFGLGLYICKLLCEHHNGYLQIRNTVNGANVSAYFKSPTL